MVARWVVLHGDLEVSEIGRQHVRAYRDHLAQLKGRAGASLAVGTIRRNLGTLSAVLGWCEDEDLIQSNPCRGVRVHDPEPNREKRLPYDQADLEAIFMGPVHARGERPKGGGGEAAYWLPHLSLWTGARLEELGQLLVSDVRTEGAPGGGQPIAYLDLNTLDPTKRLKSKAARRQIPLHSALRQLGFLDYVAKRRAEDGPDAPLWPLLERNRAGKLTAGFSRWWSVYGRGTLGLTDPRKSFHSLRHAHRDLHRVAGLEEALSDQLMGHSSNGRSQGRSYGRGYPLNVCAEWIEKLRLPGGLELAPRGSASVSRFCEAPAPANGVARRRASGGLVEQP
jgi:integrase